MSSAFVHTTRHGGIAVLQIDNPPVNALAQPVREALLEALTAAEDTLGPAAILAGIRHFAKIHGATYWTPAPLLVQIAERGETFQGWQERRTS